MPVADPKPPRPFPRKLALRIGIPIALFVLLLLLKGVLYRWCIGYALLQPRPLDLALEADTRQALLKDMELTGLACEPWHITQWAQARCSDRLSFTTSHAPYSAQGAWQAQQANCIGYAALCAALCNLAFMDCGHPDWHAHVEVAQLHLLGINLHDFTDNPFFRDHDIVSVEGPGVRWLLDPSVHDYLGIGSVQARSAE